MAPGIPLAALLLGCPVLNALGDGRDCALFGTWQLDVAATEAAFAERRLQLDLSAKEIEEREAARSTEGAHPLVVASVGPGYSIPADWLDLTVTFAPTYVTFRRGESVDSSRCRVRRLDSGGFQIRKPLNVVSTQTGEFVPNWALSWRVPLEEDRWLWIGAPNTDLETPWVMRPTSP
jgi:hypothetical protein